MLSRDSVVRAQLSQRRRCTVIAHRRLHRYARNNEIATCASVALITTECRLAGLFVRAS